jgi:hypothetical protein
LVELAARLIDTTTAEAVDDDESQPLYAWV